MPLPRSTLAGIVVLATSSASAAVGEVTIEFTHVPAFGDQGGAELTGAVGGLNEEETASYVVAVYIFTTLWYTKPQAATPTVPLSLSGEFAVDITLVASDAFARRVAAFVLPSPSPGNHSAAVVGELALPDWLGAESVAFVCHKRGMLSLSGHDWEVKDAEGAAVGPGPNFFTSRVEEVATGIQLRVLQLDGRWYSSEVKRPCDPVLGDCLGYGMYAITVTGPLAELDENVVLGLFTWEIQSSEVGNREMDFEFARWGDASDRTNAQFVIQPFERDGNLRRVVVPGSGEITVTCVVTWEAQRVHFRMFSGTHTVAEACSDSFLSPIAEWTYTNAAAIPTPGREWFRFNLWQHQGRAPANGQGETVVVNRFEHVPFGDAKCQHQSKHLSRFLARFVLAGVVMGAVCWAVVGLALLLGVRSRPVGARVSRIVSRPHYRHVL